MFVLTLSAGIAITLLLLEFTGLVAGGIIVPAYVSLMLSSPASLGLLFVLSLSVLMLLRGLSQLMPLYGTRRYGLSVLIGGVLNAIAHAYVPPAVLAVEWSAFGYLVPGLIAWHFERQGVFLTVIMIAIAAPLTRAVVLLLQMLPVPG